MSSERPQTVAQWVKYAADTLALAEVASARLDSLILLEKVLDKKRSWLLAHDDEILSSSQFEKLNYFLNQRKKHVPLAYITNTKEFYGREFLVNKNVLIPRPESEVIIEFLLEIVRNEELSGANTKNDWFLSQAKNDNKSSTSHNAKLKSQPSFLKTIIDVGTGSGCLAITIKKELPDLHVTAVDVSDEALKVAKINASLHNVQIQWKNMDILLQGLPKIPKTRPYILIANLPYVPDGLITSEEITKEPSIALFSGEDGLNHYRGFWDQVSKLKNKPHYVITESLKDQHKTMSQLCAEAGYKTVKTKDLIQLFSN